MARQSMIVTGLVLDESVSFSFGELCRGCGVSAERVMEMVEEGVVEPQGADPARWRFSGTDLERVRRALRLTRDLGVNLAGAALALELMEELEALRRRPPPMS